MNPKAFTTPQIVIFILALAVVVGGYLAFGTRTQAPQPLQTDLTSSTIKSNFQDTKVTVLNPNGGEVFRQGEEITIKWETKGGSEVTHKGGDFRTSGLGVNVNLLKSGMVVSGLEVGTGSGAGVIGGGPSDSFRWKIPDFINENISSEGRQFKIQACLEYRKVVPYDCRYECPAPGYTIDVTPLGCDESDGYFSVQYNSSGPLIKFAPPICTPPREFSASGFCSETVIWSNPLATSGQLYLVQKDSGGLSLIGIVRAGQQNFLIDTNQAASLSTKFKAGWYYFELKLDNGEKYDSSQFYIWP